MHKVYFYRTTSRKRCVFTVNVKSIFILTSTRSIKDNLYSKLSMKNNVIQKRQNKIYKLAIPIWRLWKLPRVFKDRQLNCYMVTVGFRGRGVYSDSSIIKSVMEFTIQLWFIFHSDKWIIPRFLVEWDRNCITIWHAYCKTTTNSLFLSVVYVQFNSVSFTELNPE